MEHGDGTRCAHAGLEVAPGATFVPSPVFGSAFHLGGADYYGGASNPSWRALESALGELDGGHCVSFASGMAAIATLVRTVVSAGDLVVLPSDGYYLARDYVRTELGRFGVLVREVPTAEIGADSVDGAALVLLETPANPGLDVADIARIAEAVHARGGLLAVDNTTATPLGQRPLELGADVCLSSDTKAVAGHSDVVLGHVSCVSGELAQQLRTARRGAGATPGSFEVWMVHRGLQTLDLRLQRQAENAAALAGALRELGVPGLRWPGADWDPAHAVAERQMRRYNGVLCFELESEAAFTRFLERTTLVADATSFGGVHSSADRRARFGDPVPEGFVRFSCGIENTADLVADVVHGVGQS
ncbi:cystathionine gamma-lyase [Sciscionella sediminilitoris]|uniref:cystathionine gamma-lyase n=1 Tax=Sciscionella sediminilitoris TaxID=1445613 RepID=UPI0004DECCED|nr:cystathionine gamma-lyase [Sciscionella sp. SE31]